MLLRISLIVAIIAALAAGALSYIEVTDKIPALAKQRDEEHTIKVATMGELKQTKSELGKTKSELAQTKTELAETKSERDKAIARGDSMQKRADDLNEKLAKATRERDDAQNTLASYKATGLTPEQVVKLNKNLKDAMLEIEAINGEKSVLMRNLVKVRTQLESIIGTNSFVILPADLRGKILQVDPKWDFVILNIGEDKGVLPNGELLVSRDGKLVAKVIVRSIQKDRCIANVIPGWKLGDPVEGDEVSPAHPAT